MKRLLLVLLVAVVASGCAHKEAPPPAEPVRQTAAPAPAPAEPDEEMHVEGTLGTLSDDQINGPFQRRWDDITRCYTDAQEKLPYLGGRLEIKVRVGATGGVTKAYVSSSTMGSYPAEKCILGVARELTFSKPHGGSEAEFTYPLEFRGQRPVSTWDEARVQPAVAKHHRDVSQCKAKSPNGLPPGVALTVYVAPGGRVTSAGVAADAPIDDAFAGCLVDKARTWRLDDPLGRIAKATVEVRE
jgi:hypothetical protein